LKNLEKGQCSAHSTHKNYIQSKKFHDFFGVKGTVLDDLRHMCPVRKA
jgi:hypothetical protein